MQEFSRTDGKINLAFKMAPSYSVSAGLYRVRSSPIFWTAGPALVNPDIPHDHYLPFEDIIIVHQTGTEAIYRALLQFYTIVSATFHKVVYNCAGGQGMGIRAGNVNHRCDDHTTILGFDPPMSCLRSIRDELEDVDCGVPGLEDPGRLDG
jgi:hypothetical protein